ncbi:MAG: hypothetical protein ACYTG0_24825 [Planctomycetota bacterium]|jgi:hypothetical protein
MKRSIPRAALAFAAIVVLGLSAGHALADDPVERPFDFSIEAIEVTDIQGNSFTVLGVGQATHMGTVTFVNYVRRFGDRAVAMRTIEAADGDQLFLYHDTEFDETLRRYVGTYEILGGTGKFEGATGSGIQIQGIGCSGTICY